MLKKLKTTTKGKGTVCVHFICRLTQLCLIDLIYGWELQVSKIIISEKINYALTITSLPNRLSVCVIHCDISDFIPVQGSCFLTIYIQQCLSNPAAVPKVAFQSTTPAVGCVTDIHIHLCTFINALLDELMRSDKSGRALQTCFSHSLYNP